MDLIEYSDSDFAGDKQTRRSTTGYLIKISGGPVAWTSRQQQCVVLSTTEAEYIAASHVTKEAMCLMQLLEDIGENYCKPVVLCIDNQSAMK